MKYTFLYLVIILIILSNPSHAQNTGNIKFTDEFQNEKICFRDGPIYILIIDIDENKDSANIDSIIVFVESLRETSSEEIFLAETELNSGIFLGIINTDVSIVIEDDGILQVSNIDDIFVQYNDRFDDFGNETVIRDSVIYGLTEIPGLTIADIDVTWSFSDSPYLITGDINISNSTLTLEPGVEVRFLPHFDNTTSGFSSNLSEININDGSEFIALGTLTDSIKFTSHSRNPSSKDWYSIIVQSSGNLKLAYSRIEAANIGLLLNKPTNGSTIEFSEITNNFIGVKIDKPTLTPIIIQNNELTNNFTAMSLVQYNDYPVDLDENLIRIFKNIIYGKGEGNGILINNGTGNPIISNNKIELFRYGLIMNSTNCSSEIYRNEFQNNEIGISISNTQVLTNDDGPIINFNNLNNNFSFGIENNSLLDIDAKFNWWGEDATIEMDLGDNPKNISYIYDQYDESSKGFVNYSNWLNSKAFTDVPSLIAPINNSTDQAQELVFKWSSLNNALYYHLQISKTEDFIILEHSDSTISDTLITISDLESNKNYFWRVAAKNEFCKSEFSNVFNFSTIYYLPDTITLISPSDSLTSGSSQYQFLWNNDHFAEEYSLEISYAENFDSLMFSKDGISDTSYTITSSFNSDFFWRVRGYNIAGSGEWSNPNYVRLIITNYKSRKYFPKEYFLSNNYPNPFNPSTKINYSLPQNSFVTLKVYDILGNLVKEIIGDQQQAGYYEYKFDGGNLSSGIYYYTISAEDFHQTKKMILLK